MTTKIRIIVGFSAMVLIMAVVAALGYSGLQRSSSGFEEYRRLARLNVLTSDMTSGIATTTTHIYLFTTTDDEKHLDVARDELKKVSALVEESTPFVRQDERKKMLLEVAEGDKKLQSIVESVKSLLADVLKQYNTVVIPSSHSMTKQLVTMHEAALRENDTQALKLIVTATGQMGTARSAASRFSQSRDKEDSARADTTLTEFGESLVKIGPLLETREAQAEFETAKQLYADLQTALNNMTELCKAFQADMKQIAETNTSVNKALDALNVGVNADMLKQGTLMLASNATDQKMTMGVSVGGVVLGVILAMISIMGILRVLRELGVFAGAIAAGKFSHQVKITEKGEVGQMVIAMKQIPNALNAILAEYKELEERVVDGYLSAEGDEKKFSGDFSTLVKGTNAILSRYHMVLDSIPSPVVMLDHTQKASYLNTVAREVYGAEFKGKSSHQLLANEDADSSACGLKKALESKRSCTAETRSHSHGKKMDISYTVIPMYDTKGSLTSVLQLITDLTEIKNTQRTIMNVAEQAATISNRVAAASEELSAQVEQVSRGAEMQRDRVESTASAMTEMNATVLEVARSAGQASEQSELTRSKADDGAGLVNKVVASINKVNKVATAMHANMQELGKRAESIGGVMNVISDIADQTNLLALNAAIEAARAGEAGRGFAVVADEVRKLAEKTMAATGEVGGNITAIQNSAKVNIDAMADASQAVSEATELASASGSSLGEIVGLASSNSAVVASIATAAEEQSATSEEINRSINEIHQIVNETADGMVQASAAVQELSRMAQELNRVMAELQK